MDTPNFRTNFSQFLTGRQRCVEGGFGVMMEDDAFPVDQL